MDNSKNYTYEYFIFLKRQRKKMWGKRAEKPRWRLINKLLRQRLARENNYIYYFHDEIEKFTTQMAEAMEKAMNKINKTFKEIGEEMNEQLKNI